MLSAAEILATAPAAPLARRFLNGLIDLYVPFLIAFLITPSGTRGNPSDPTMVTWLVILGANGLLSARTGWSVGMWVAGVRLVRWPQRTAGAPMRVGVLRVLVLSLLWLWLLLLFRDRDGRTLLDRFFRVAVVQVRGLQGRN